MQIEYTRESIKQIKNLDKFMKQRVKHAIEKLPEGDIKKLKGFKNDYRLRVGDYRILFSSAEGQIIVKAVLPRGKVYKRM